MSVQTEITRIKSNITAALTAIAEKGVDVPDGSTSDALAGLIASIEGGGGSDIQMFGDRQYRYGSFTLAEDVTSTYTVYFDELTCSRPTMYTVFLFLDQNETKAAGVSLVSGGQISIGMYGYSYWLGGSYMSANITYGMNSSGNKTAGSETPERSSSSFGIPFTTTSGKQGIAGCKYYWLVVSMA